MRMLSKRIEGPRAQHLLRLSLWSFFHAFSGLAVFISSATAGVLFYGGSEGSGLSSNEQRILIANAAYAYLYSASWLFFAISGKLASFWPTGIFALFLSVLEATGIKNNHSILLLAWNEGSPVILLVRMLLRLMLDGFLIYPVVLLTVGYAVTRYLERQARSE